MGERAAFREQTLKASRRRDPLGSDLSDKKELVRQSWRESLPGRGHSECKGPEAGTSVASCRRRRWGLGR